MSNFIQPPQEEIDDPYAVYSSNDEDVIQSDEDLEQMPGMYIDAPVIAKQLVCCSNKGCEGDALRRHSRDKCRWPDGAFCLKCRVHGKPLKKREHPSANQDWQEEEFQSTMKELKVLIDKEGEEGEEEIEEEIETSTKTQTNRSKCVKK